MGNRDAELGEAAEGGSGGGGGGSGGESAELGEDPLDGGEAAATAVAIWWTGRDRP